MAIAHYNDDNKTDLFDKNDNELTPEQFKAGTGFNPYDLIKKVKGNTEHVANMQSSRKKYNDAKDAKKKAQELIANFNGSGRNEEIEKMLKNTHTHESYEALNRYMDKVYKHNGKVAYPADFELYAVSKKPNLFLYLDSPTENTKLTALSRSGYLIKLIDHPTKEMELAAVNDAPDAIKYIKNPSEDLQLAAVNRNKNAIVFIKNPTQKVKAMAGKT